MDSECCNAECGWKGTTGRMLGAVGPLCPECGEVTEPVQGVPESTGAANGDRADPDRTFMHISFSEVREGIPSIAKATGCDQEDCPSHDPSTLEPGFGLAGGGMGSYVSCALCGQIRGKDLSPEYTDEDEGAGQGGEAGYVSDEPKHCTVCDKQLNVPGDEFSTDVGGDCIVCKAEAGDPDCQLALDVIRAKGSGGVADSASL